LEVVKMKKLLILLLFLIITGYHAGVGGIPDGFGCAQAFAVEVKDVVDLAKKADAARQAYLVAQTANPTADLSKLYKAEMAAVAAWSIAENQAIFPHPGPKRCLNADERIKK